jgi:hypothetical protein
MADTKISALPASTVPLAGTEVLPLVQSGATKKVAVSDLTAGRAVSALSMTLTGGNLVVPSGNGVDFSATSGSGLSELLADYEEGVWTPTMLTTGTNFASITYDGRTAGKYVKIGQLVYVMGTVRTNSIDTTGATGTVAIGNLPFTVAAAQAGPLFDNSSPGSVANVGDYLSNFPINIKAAASSTRLDLQYRLLVGGADDNLPIASVDTGLGKNYTSFTCCYVAA